MNETVGHLPVPSGGEGGALPSQPAASSTEASNEAEDDAKGVELSKEVRASVFYILLQLCFTFFYLYHLFLRGVVDFSQSFPMNLTSSHIFLS